MNNEQLAASIKPGTIVFAAGNKYKVSETGVSYSEKFGFIVAGYKMIKSKGTFSGQSNRHAVGHGAPAIVE